MTRFICLRFTPPNVLRFILAVLAGITLHPNPAIARPTETTSTDVTAVGQYELQGGVGWWRDMAGNEFSQLVSVFNWGLTRSAQLEFKVTDDHLHAADGHAAESETFHFRSMIQLWSDGAKKLTIGIQPELIINADVHDSDGITPLNEALTLAITWQLQDETYLDFNVAYNTVSRINSSACSSFWGLAIRRNLPGRWQLMSEIYTQVPSHHVANTFSVFDLAINYTSKSGFRPDLLVGVGLNKTSPKLILEAGFTYDW